MRSLAVGGACRCRDRVFLLGHVPESAGHEPLSQKRRAAVALGREIDSPLSLILIEISNPDREMRDIWSCKRREARSRRLQGTGVRAGLRRRRSLHAACVTRVPGHQRQTSDGDDARIRTSSSPFLQTPESDPFPPGGVFGIEDPGP